MRKMGCKNMMYNDLISIIIPVYNVEKYIEKCVDSILNQSYKNIEIIFIIDGSEDDSEKILRKYQKLDNRIYIYNQENKGVSIARNVGIKRSNGIYVMFVDADDWINKDTIKIMLEKKNSNNVDIIKCCFSREFVQENMSLPSEKMYEKDVFIKKYQFDNLLYPLFLNSYFYNSVCGQLIKLENIKNIKFNEGIEIGEDLLFNLELYFNIENVLVITDNLYHYRCNTQSATRNISKLNFLKKNEDILYVYSKFFEYFKNIDIINKQDISLKVIKEISSSILLMFIVADVSNYEKVKFLDDILNNIYFTTICEYISNDYINSKTIKNKYIIKKIYNKDIQKILIYGKFVYAPRKKIIKIIRYFLKLINYSFNYRKEKKYE